jgi:uncharacterized protein YndB with AHSA1/START domain
MKSTPQIRIDSFIEADPAIVWQMITDSKMVSQWLMETNIRPEPGFKGYFKMKPMPGFDGNIQSEVLQVEENRLFMYTWQGGWMKTPTTIKFTLQQKPNGTLLTLEHWGFEGFFGSMLKRMMSGGWKKKITQLIPQLIVSQ